MSDDRLEGTPTQRTLRLRDGRRVGWAEYGVPNGRPVLGIFGATARFFRPPDEVTVAAGVRLIWLERPGIGLSDPLPDRSLLEWTADVLALADALRLDRFAVVGGWQGGPYGAACAYQLPERLTVVGLVSALAPFEAPGVMQGMALPLRMLPVLARRAPGLLALSQRMAARLVRRNPAAFVQQAFGNLPEVDQHVFRTYPSVKAWLITDAAEIYRQGGEGVTQDIRTVCRSWGFRLEDIRARVVVWQGEDDPDVPPAMGRYLARTTPNCRAYLVPRAGHLLGFSHWGEILESPRVEEAHTAGK